MTIPKLKPCPFCGEVPDVDSIGIMDCFHYSAAVVCCIIGPMSSDVTGMNTLEWKIDAAKQWNKRC